VRLLGCLFDIIVNPTALFANIRHLALMSVETRCSRSISKSDFMHRRRACSNNDRVKSVLLYASFDQCLAWFRAKVPVVGRDHNVGSLAGSINNFADANRSGNIQAAMTDEYSHTFHG